MTKILFEKTPSFVYMIRQKILGKSFLYEFYFKGKKTIDIGCGEGEFMKLGKSHIWGVDTNNRVIQRLKSEGYFAEYADGGKLPFKDETFDMAHCHNVIEHLDVDKAYAMLSEAGRVLKKDGKLVLSSEVPNRRFWDTFGHVKPYTPVAVMKLMRPNSREEFDAIETLEPIGLFYLGDYYKNQLMRIFAAVLGHYTPILRREYFLIFRRK